MKIRFIRDHDARTPTGSRRITAGTVLDLSSEKAERLVSAGIAAPEPDGPGVEAQQEELQPGSCIIWRTAGNRRVFLVRDHIDRDKLQGEGEAWFCREEMELMKGATQETVNLIINLKELFGGAIMRNKLKSSRSY